MRIGVDARELSGRTTGVGRYLAGLLREWSGMASAAHHDFVLYAPEALGTTLDSRRFRPRVVTGAPGTWWEQVQLPRVAANDHLDVFFSPAYTAPLRLDVPTVLTIHDLSFVAHPEWFRLREGIRRRWLTRKSAGRAQAIVTVSAFSRREILEHFGESDDRIFVIPQGIDPPKVTRRRPDSAPRVLYVGSLFNRRHVPELICAIETLSRSRPEISLDIVGDDRTFPREDLDRTIADPRLGGRVRWHRYATDDQLNELYDGARAFAFLSEYEGLGMTPLEALGAGIPPVLYDTPVARESCGGAALYVPVGDRAGIVRALEDALFNENTRAAILAAAPKVLAKYDWPRAAQETLAVIESAAKS